MQKETKHKLKKVVCNITISLLIVGAVIGSVCVAFTAFHFVIAIIGTCHFIIGSTSDFVNSPFVTVTLVGAMTIGIIVFIKTYLYLLKLIFKYKDMTFLKEVK